MQRSHTSAKPLTQRASLVIFSLQVLVQAGAPINQKADGTFFHPKYGEGYPIVLNQIQAQAISNAQLHQGPADKQACKEHKL